MRHDNNGVIRKEGSTNAKRNRILGDVMTVEGSVVPKKKKATRRRSPNKKKPVVCSQCGRAFMARRKDAKYCSQQCYKAAHNMGAQPKPEPAPKPDDDTVTISRADYMLLKRYADQRIAQIRAELTALEDRHK